MSDVEDEQYEEEEEVEEPESEAPEEVVYFRFYLETIQFPSNTAMHQLLFYF